MDIEEHRHAETAGLGLSVAHLSEQGIRQQEPNGQLLPSQSQGQGQQESRLARGNLWRSYYEDPNIDEA
jgi:hypothetical protein